MTLGCRFWDTDGNQSSVFWMCGDLFCTLFIALSARGYYQALLWRLLLIPCMSLHCKSRIGRLVEQFKPFSCCISPRRVGSYHLPAVYPCTTHGQALFTLSTTFKGSLVWNLIQARYGSKQYMLQGPCLRTSNAMT